MIRGVEALRSSAEFRLGRDGGGACDCSPVFAFLKGCAVSFSLARIHV